MSNDRIGVSGGGWPRIAATLGALAGVIGLSTIATAQSPGSGTTMCARPIPSTFLDRDHVVDARSVVGVDGGLLILGEFVARIDRSQATPTLDTSIVALFGRDDGSVRGLRMPAPSFRVSDPKAIPVSDHAARVFFHTNARGSEHEPFDLWTGIIANGDWSRLQRIGTFQNAIRVGAEVSDGPILWRGSPAFAFAQDTLVVLVVAEPDSARAIRVRTGLWGIGDVSLAAQGDDLWIALAAGGVETREFGDIFVGRIVDGTLVAARRVAVGGLRQVRQPRLLSTAQGVVVAWLSEDPQSGTSSLGWRVVDDSTAPENQLLARWPIARASHPFTDLLAVPVSDRTAMVVELLPQGFRTLATIESRVLAPAVGGSGERLRAVSWIADTSKSSGVRPAIHDLSCGLRRGDR